jgi:hypothetical protein
MEITLEERNYFNQLDERQQRLYVGLKAKLLGYHGVRLVSVAYNVNIKTVRKGKAELSDLSPIPIKRIRKVGGGPKKKLKPTPNY